jgi:hypothetical protein
LSNEEQPISSKDEQLIEEIETTVGGIYRGIDPREQAVLDAEEARLKKLALQTLIAAKKRKKFD